MNGFWLLKTEPNNYSYADLERDGATIWDGVSSNAALKHMRAMQAGDLALIYHTGDERQAIGLAAVTSAAYPDPNAGDARLVVVDVKPLRRLVQPVTLAAVKRDPAFADFALVREGRLSVVPVTQAQWERLMQMAGESELF